jgi:hypothetical protein
MTDSNYRNRDYGARSSQEDDPLMELSRIIGFDEPVKNAASREEADDFSFDLEQELVGAVEAELDVAPQGRYAPQNYYQPAAQPRYQQAAQQGWSVPRQLASERDFAPARNHESHSDFSSALEDELNLSLDSDVELPGDFSLDAPFGEQEDMSIYEPALEAEEEAAPQYVAAPNLEDELEMLLAGKGRAPEAPHAFAQQYAAPRDHVTAPVHSQPAEAPRYPYYPSRSQAAPVSAPLATASQAQQPAPQAHGWDEAEAQLDEDFFDADAGQYEAETDGAPQVQPEAYAIHSAYRYAGPAPAPQVETVTVAESKVEQTDALDLPEVEYESEPQQGHDLTALETEFADVFNSLEVDDPAQPESKQTQAADRTFEDIFNDVYGAYGAAQSEQHQQDRYQADYQDDSASGMQGDYSNHWAAAPSAQDFRYDQQSASGVDIPAAANENRPSWARRGLMMGSVAGIALLIGGFGYYSLSSGGGDGTPVVIAADAQPTKVQPENPGGNPVPNQDKAVYDRVAGTAPDAPAQKTLVTSEEDPVDLAAAEDDDGGMDDTAVNDRVAPSMLETAAANDPEPNPAFQPRRVQTMIVRPDGTIVQQEAAPAAPASNDVAAATPRARPAGTEVAALTQTPAPQPIVDDVPETGAIPAREVTKQETPPPPSNAQTSASAPARVVKTQAITPDAAVSKPPVVPSRPAEQPVRIVGDATAASGQARANTQVASAAGTAKPATAAAKPAASAGGYAIQIASTPTAEDAQKSYANLSRRFGNVIGGRGVDIRRADVPGKGTFYRVRINAGSKENAVELCTKYKAAGGSCFVTQ